MVSHLTEQEEQHTRIALKILEKVHQCACIDTEHIIVMARFRT